MNARIASLQEKLLENHLDSLFVSSQPNVIYLTGFNGLSPDEREGFLFVTLYNAYLLTFPTYYELYKNGGKDFVSLNITSDKRIHHHVLDIIQKEKIETIGFEEENLTVSELNSLEKKLQKKLTATAGLIEELRKIKDIREIAWIAKAADLTDKTFEYVKTKIKNGISEKELALEIEFFTKRNGGENAFDPIVAFNENSAIPHHLSGDKKLNSNSLILLDFGAKISGYCSDMTRVIFWGTPSAKMKKVYDTVLASQKKALSLIKAGVNGADIDYAARQVIVSAGFESYPHGLGHGVGLQIHESPRMKENYPQILPQNSVITVEPGIYIPGFCGVRIEDLVVLKKEEVEMLSKSPKLLKILK
ncbi:hypothetical protein A3D77_02580 [Candidatus Gottesmanbacteria bacterium RIFCSPHIGHO2_02_FULL_39_11]|uniref:Peptidase M24 domain-containing protein n=1 Tax=Candidatus Gottesmanbacteria bacterium RIFCSPHIGHO2_02_FULL_39_11 TaxID=1798382 RepID=A0A1F5ZSZ3_9BACT|nr:MAG: hypothetical protein A3D77_02580 [Candidatus Gottesmanbacteria bacterium RIFCSPHIGHO2_02_FULL_39_11]